MKSLKMKFILGLMLVVVTTALQSKAYAASEQHKAVVEISQAGDIPKSLVTMPEVAALPDQLVENAGVPLYAQNTTTDQLNDASTASMADDPGTVVNDSLPPSDTSTGSATVLNILKTNWAELLFGLLAFIKILVRLTPTLKDDTVFGKIDSLISWLVPNLQKKKSA
jgi:hypothetical protein